MGKSNQNRVTIPKWMREKTEMKKGDKLYLIFINKGEILISREKTGKVIGIVKIDEKGRFFFPKDIQNVFSIEKMVLYSEGDKIGMLFLDRGA